MKLKLKEVLKNLSGYYFIRDKHDKCICTNHKDYLTNDYYTKATKEILKQYENYKVSKINGAYDGWSSPWVDLYIKEEQYNESN